VSGVEKGRDWHMVMRSGGGAEYETLLHTRDGTRMELRYFGRIVILAVLNSTGVALQVGCKLHLQAPVFAQAKSPIRNPISYERSDHCSSERTKLQPDFSAGQPLNDE
jgi:hypothetical protein